MKRKKGNGTETREKYWGGPEREESYDQEKGPTF